MLAVVAYHYEHRIKGGYLGVTVFFVLSGYLITGLLRTERENRGWVDLSAFYARRALRLFPALIVVVIGTLVLATVTGHQEVSTVRLYEGAGASLLYINDFVLAVGHPTVWLDPTWSLGVEEQFYLIWPILLIVALRRLPAALIGRLCIGIACAAGAFYVVIRPQLGFGWTYFSPVGSVMPLLLGCGLSFVAPRVSRWLAVVAGALLVILVFAAPAGESVACWRGPQQLAAIAAVIVIAYLAGPGMKLMRSGGLVWLGRRSYGIYLIHVVVLEALINAVPGIPGMAHNLVGLPVTLVLAALSYRFVEQPFLRRKTRFSRTLATTG